MSDWTDTRPMSPHTSIWKWHITMAGSILHRVTGVANYMGAILIVAWLVSAAAGYEAYELYAFFAGAWYGQLVLFGFTLSVCYHALNGVRHLFLDTGNGYTPKIADLTSWLVLLGAVVLAVGVWVLAGLVPGVKLGML